MEHVFECHRIQRRVTPGRYSNGVHRNVSKMLEAVLGTSTNVTTSVNGRLRWSPDRMRSASSRRNDVIPMLTALRLPRSPLTTGCHQYISLMYSQMTTIIAKMHMRTIGQAELMKRRRWYLSCAQTCEHMRFAVRVNIEVHSADGVDPARAVTIQSMMPV